MFDITEIVKVLFLLICAICSCIVLPYFKAKYNVEQLNEVKAWIKIAVDAAEQIYVGSGRGAEKKKYVIDFLTQNNIFIDEEQLDAMIESAVYKLKHL